MKLNSFSDEFLVVGGEIVLNIGVVYGQLCSSLSSVSPNRGQKLVEIVSNWLSVSTIDRSFFSLDRIQVLIIFHRDPGLSLCDLTSVRMWSHSAFLRSCFTDLRASL